MRYDEVFLDFEYIRIVFVLFLFFRAESLILIFKSTTLNRGLGYLNIATDLYMLYIFFFLQIDTIFIHIYILFYFPSSKFKLLLSFL